jgi:hypothetical protein
MCIYLKRENFWMLLLSILFPQKKKKKAKRIQMYPTSVTLHFPIPSWGGHQQLPPAAMGGTRSTLGMVPFNALLLNDRQRRRFSIR